MSTEAAARAFFAKPSFAVVGASNDPAKFGHKIFAWYTAHNLPVTPINPSAAAIAVGGRDFPTVPQIGALPSPAQTAVSFVTPPPVTLETLRKAQGLGIEAVWLQPGTFDAAVLAYLNGGSSSAGGQQKPFPTVVAGAGGRGSEGWCVLVDGERALKANGKL
ncbi:succinyl CoA synthetase-like protein [Niveomyces insectorum RCEF 264]|uniref:Succinyl CoA synthetase-like protein n=1 Tax=Niveomyces insectorum RCEF 264 TaxID=1081102 RepID=A0A167YZ22_9HYPO|nr:succinyl CoA synthetase-like protein [Niveomyces insectorum RCEF 264]